MIHVRPLVAEDLPWKTESLRAVWGSTTVARLGEALDARGFEGFVALNLEERVGLLTYALRGDEFEIVTLQASCEGIGVGRALMEAARERGREAGARRIWLITTNNNERARRFYQRWGMNLCAIYQDGVARSRAVKPSIPLVDRSGAMIADELEFELVL